MIKIRNVFILVAILFSSTSHADAQVSVGIGLPHVNIGINVSAYPEFVIVPGYPVYYAPRMEANFFFYDGSYWVYQNDNWYESSWYNGPWWLVYPEDVPLFILRIPVRYYRMPPAYFIGWQHDAPPRWGNHWGRDWSQRRSGWDRWDHRYIPAPAPLPSYQRQYSGNHYPQQVEQQRELQQQNYDFQTPDPQVRKHKDGQAHSRPVLGQDNRTQGNRRYDNRQESNYQEYNQGLSENRESNQQDDRRSPLSQSQAVEQDHSYRSETLESPRSRSPDDGGVRFGRSPQSNEKQSERNGRESKPQQGQEVLQTQQNAPIVQGQNNRLQNENKSNEHNRRLERSSGGHDSNNRR